MGDWLISGALIVVIVVTLVLLKRGRAPSRARVR